MPITTVTCHVAKCDSCGDGWQNNDEYGTPHHPIDDPSTPTFLTDLIKAEDDGGHGWTDIDGVLRCKDCSEKHTCAQQGHDWMPWRTCLCGGRNTHAEGTTREHRSCERCGAYEQRTVPGTCETLPPPVELSRGAQLVQWRRNRDLHVAAGHDGTLPVGDEELPDDVRLLVSEAVAAVERLDDALAGGGA